jgi:hypothetical protein
MDGEWVKTTMMKMFYGIITLKVEHPTLVEKASVKSYSKSDMVHMMLELEYVLSSLPNLETNYMLHRLQICLKVRVALPVLRLGHIIKNQFLAMWVVEDLEWKKILAYSIVCCYIQYHQSRAYKILEFEVGYLGLYSLRYYCRLEHSYDILHFAT